MKEMSKMERLFSQTNIDKTLSDYYPPTTTSETEVPKNLISIEQKINTIRIPVVMLKVKTKNLYK